MTVIEKKISIAAPADAVWRVLADFGGVSCWAPTTFNSRCTTVIIKGVGARRVFELASGKTAEEEIVAWDEGRSFTFVFPESHGPIAALRETWAVDESSGGSVVIVSLEFRLKFGFFGALMGHLFVARRMGFLLVRNLAGLKHFVETGAHVGDRCQV